MTEEKSITVVVPIPQYNQNTQSHYRVKALKKKKDWETSKENSMVAIADLDDWESFGFPWPTASIHLRWLHKTSKHRDIWNIIGSMKPTIDGIVRAGVLADDDQIQPPTVERLTDRKDPRVEITLTYAI